MGYQKYDSRHQKDVIYISVNQSLVYIPLWTYEKIGKAERYEIWYDKEESEIKLIPSSIGCRVSNYKKGFVAFPIRLSNKMPIGKYFFGLAEQGNDKVFRFKAVKGG